MIWLSVALAITLVVQEIVHRREVRRLTDLVVARHAPEVAAAAGVLRPRRHKAETPATVKLSEGID